MSDSKSRLSRRALLGAAAAGFSTRRLRAATGVDPITRKLADYMAGVANKALPAEVAEKAKHHVLDTFAAMISGMIFPPAAQH